MQLMAISYTLKDRQLSYEGGKYMKKHQVALALTGVLAMNTLQVAAAPGESGYFGGISEGILLPKTINTELNTKKPKDTKLYYKEVVFLSGEPIEVSGYLTIKKVNSAIKTKDKGTYKEEYTIDAVSADGKTSLKRVVGLDTLFVNYNNLYSTQTKTDSTVTKWKETLNINGTSYTVDEERSDFGKGRNFASYIQDVTPGINYFNGNQSYRLVYVLDGSVYAEVIMSGDSYGFDQPWSKAEKQSYTMNIDKKGSEPWQMEVKLTPFVNAKKELDYKKNNLPAISFAGTFTQIFHTEGGMYYNIETNHPTLNKDKYKGSYFLTTPNDFEKLRIPGRITYLNPTNYAYDAVRSLMALGVVEESPLTYQPFEAITRGEFATVLCRAMNILPPDQKEIDKFKKSGEVLFPDVANDHPLYNWMYAAKEAGLIHGKDQNYLQSDEPLTREEAFTLLMRVIGLEHISADVSGQTPYLDDGEISPWAKPAIYGGSKLGLFKGFEGKIAPKNYVSRADSSVIVNRLIDFLRKDMVKYYQNN